MSIHKLEPNRFSASSVEKGSAYTYEEYKGGDDNGRYSFDCADLDRVQRKLKQRHVQMIAIAGTLGTGLFLGSGKAIAMAGPAGALIAYALVATVAYASLSSLSEMTSHAPISGTFPHFAARWVDPALGFAVGWNYWYSSTITVPVEISAASILLTFWDTNTTHQYLYIALLILGVVGINLFGLRWFGESEFLFSIIKLCLITSLIVAGLVIDLGAGPDHDARGFRFWSNPGAFAGAGLAENMSTDRFVGMLVVVVQAAYSFQGMELVAIAASETENPRRNVSKAVKRVFFRILVFYLLGTFIIGLIVPSNDPDLMRLDGTAAESPYVIALKRAGVRALPSVINAAIFTAAFSAANSYLFCGSRILYGLALRGQAPAIFARCTRQGVPLRAVLFCASFCLLSFLTVSQGAVTVFNALVSVSTVGGFLSWATINLTYIFFARGLKAQGFNREKLVYHSRLQPFLAWWGLGWNIVFVLIAGVPVFFQFSLSGFFSAYINIPLFIGLYVFWKLYKKSRMWTPKDMDFVTGIPTIEETEAPEVPLTKLSDKILAHIF